MTVCNKPLALSPEYRATVRAALRRAPINAHSIRAEHDAEVTQIEGDAFAAFARRLRPANDLARD